MGIDNFCNELFASARDVFKAKTYERFVNNRKEEEVSEIALKTAVVAMGTCIFAAALFINPIVVIPVTAIAFSHFMRKSRTAGEITADGAQHIGNWMSNKADEVANFFRGKKA